MDVLYFERQYGALCGTHCLNNALQGRWFNEVKMSEIARELDAAELAMLDPSSAAHQELANKRESANYDDTGYFSVQVLQKALKDSYEINMEPYRIIPGQHGFNRKARIFIVNVDKHWYCFRKFRKVWVELNSLSEKPKAIAVGHLFTLLYTLLHEGHSVFQLTGKITCTQGDVWLEFDFPHRFIRREDRSLPLSVDERNNDWDYSQEGEEGLTKQEVIRRRREELLKKIEADKAAKANEEGQGPSGSGSGSQK